MVDDTVRCPWHHACFSLRTGEAVRAPALNPVACFRVDREGDRVFVRDKVDARPQRSASVVTFRAGGRTAAVATVFRDQESLEAELAMERGEN